MYLQEETRFPSHAAFVAARSPWLRTQLLRARERSQVRRVFCKLFSEAPLRFWGTEQGNMTVYFKETMDFCGINAREQGICQLLEGTTRKKIGNYGIY